MKMKKTLIIFMALMMLTVGLCACKNGEEEEETTAATEAEVNDNEFGRDNEVYYNGEWAE